MSWCASRGCVVRADSYSERLGAFYASGSENAYLMAFKIVIGAMGDFKALYLKL